MVTEVLKEMAPSFDHNFFHNARARRKGHRGPFASCDVFPWFGHYVRVQVEELSQYCDVHDAVFTISVNNCIITWKFLLYPLLPPSHLFPLISTIKKPVSLLLSSPCICIYLIHSLGLQTRALVVSPASGLSPHLCNKPPPSPSPPPPRARRCP